MTKSVIQDMPSISGLYHHAQFRTLPTTCISPTSTSLSYSTILGVFQLWLIPI